MSNERKLILEKVNMLINKRKVELLKRFPSIHEVDDGIIIRFFSEWDDCVNNIKYHKIINENNSEDITIFYFLPKGAIIELKKREYVKTISCLSGKLEVNVNGTVIYLTGFKKLSLDVDEFQGIALEDSYALTTNGF
jgi:hypothetical protein